MFSSDLQHKIQRGLAQRRPCSLGPISLASDLLLAPMAAIGSAPFRLVMEQLGAGASVSELISCHGINHGNDKTLKMLRIHPQEKNVGIQIFGEDAEAMARSCHIVQRYGPKFVDINMGCPVKKVVQKGGGSALLKDPSQLFSYFSTIRRELSVPLTIKIRTGWDSESVNAAEVTQIAHDAGVAAVAVHGRTRAQKYTGEADWDYLEQLAAHCPLPVVGNGDLHRPMDIQRRRQRTQCRALMIARGALRNPFIFLQAEDSQRQLHFQAQDYAEVLLLLARYLQEHFDHEAIQVVQLRKHALWLAAGFPRAKEFRGRLFEAKTFSNLLGIIRHYFDGLGAARPQVDYSEQFMMSGHG